MSTVGENEVLAKRCGLVAIVGRPNVGKSTLLNKIVGEKVAIVSPVPQTTRHQIRAVYQDERGQIVFVDTPGLSVAKNALSRALISSIQESLAGPDVVIHLVDVTEPLGEEEGMVLERLKRISAPVIVGINKIDRGTKYLEDYLRVWERIVGRPLSEVTQRVMPVPLSALAGTNVPCLLDEIFARLPQGPALYPDDVLTDFPRQLTIQDVIREKLFLHLRQELPFSLAVFVEEIKDTGDSLLTVRALIYVERPSQKGIVIGEKGSLLKTVGQESRLELQKIYGKKVFLELWVKVDPGWKQDHQLLQKMGYLTA